MGGSVLPSPCDTQANLYFDRHCDSGIAIRGLKLVAYLEPLGADNGALRVLPASHRLLSSSLRHLHSPDVDLGDVLAQVLTTQPGDVIVFDPFLYHASWGANDRHQWSAMYLRGAFTGWTRS